MQKIVVSNALVDMRLDKALSLSLSDISRSKIQDYLDRELSQCATDLKNTHWTQETEELRRKWNKTKEEIDSLKQNVIIIK